MSSFGISPNVLLDPFRYHFLASKGLPRMLVVGYNFELISFLHRIWQKKVRVCCARQSVQSLQPGWLLVTREK